MTHSRHRGCRALAVALAAFVAACSGFVDLEPFDALPGLDRVVGAVGPAEPYDYWELREGTIDPGGPTFAPRVLGAGGPLTRDELAPTVRALLDSINPARGFGNSCLPALCFRFLASVRGATVAVWSTSDAVLAFLGPVDTPADAALLALARGYTWGGDKSSAAVRAVSGGYELVVLRLVRACAPVQTNRYLLHIDAAGSVTERASAVWSKDARACI